MKKIISLLSVCVLFAFTTADPTISKEERKKAADFLMQTKKGVWDAMQGLSPAQLAWKPAADRWSIEECLKHIAQSEIALWEMISGGINAPANPDKRAELKLSDDDVIRNIEDRTNRVKTSAPLEPKNTPFTSTQDAWASFSSNRDKLIDYVNATGADLRNHVAILPFGAYDSYQMILFIGAHSNRHMQQMLEVKVDPNFPKS